MTLQYAGIDEAGYGPMLGPLCVAQASFSLVGWKPGDKAPDLWALLEPAVGRTKKDAKTRIPVADSKILKLANSSKTQHPLVHLERAVLAFLATQESQIPTTDIQLFQALGAKLEDQPWYAGEPIPLPLARSRDQLNIDASFLRSTMNKAELRLLDLRVQIIDVSEFNQIYLKHRSKAMCTQVALLTHLQRIHAQRNRYQHTRIICDRQSGRTHYHPMLSQVFDDLETHEESARASRYAIADELGILLTPKADNAYFPVALASMAAKLVRELAMIRFNRYWSTRQIELKPTVGYVQDARRWLSETKDTASQDERQAMIRLA